VILGEAKWQTDRIGTAVVASLRRTVPLESDEATASLCELWDVEKIGQHRPQLGE
jgi:hypothetical protein